MDKKNIVLAFTNSEFREIVAAFELAILDEAENCHEIGDDPKKSERLQTLWNAYTKFLRAINSK